MDEDLHLISGPLLLELIQAVLEKGACFRFSAPGGSMTPFILDGDIITIAPVSIKRYGIGSVVAFVRPSLEKLMVHRIVAVAQDQVLIKGDNGNDCPDGWVKKVHILGSVVQIERDGRCVRFGLGVERFMIAWLSNNNWLLPLRCGLAKIRRRNNMKTTILGF